MNKGYSKLDLTINFYGKEVYNGYKEFHLFADLNKNFPVAAIKNYEMNGGSLQKDYDRFTVSFNNIDLTSMISNMGLDSKIIFYLFLSAHGVGKDDCMIKNVSVSFDIY